MATTYSAGVVTAYGAAKQAGYTGTYEQFCQDQANFATNATQVSTDKSTVEIWMAQIAEDKRVANEAANAAQGYAETASAAFQTDLLADPYDARKRYDTGEYVIYSGVMYRCTTPITVAEAWNIDHWEKVTVGSELISALEEVITNHFNRNKTYVVGDYVIYDNMLYRCISPTKPGINWNPDQWLHITLASEFADRVTELEQSFAFPDNKNLVNPALQKKYQGSVFTGYSEYYVSAYIPFLPNTSYVLRTVNGPGDFVYEIFDKEKASLSEQIQILATDESNDMIIRYEDPDTALIRIISPIDLKDVMLTQYTNGLDFIKFKLKSSAYISTIMEQDLTDDQKTMVQHNIGLDNISEMVSGFVKFDGPHVPELSDAQKKQAQDNIGVSDAIQSILDQMPDETDLTGAVRYDGPQDPELDDNQKLQARTNIGAIGQAEISDYNDRIGELEEGISEYAGAVKRVTKNDNGLQIEYFEGEPSQVELAESEKLHLYYDPNENFLYLQNENDVAQGSPVFIAGGGGGGGSAVAATVKIQRLDEQFEPTNVSTMDIVTGDPAILRYKLQVVEAGEGGEEISGTATARWYNNSIFLTSTSITHNTPESFDIGPYLQPGTNNISVSVSAPVGGDIMMPASRGWTVKLVDLYFSWNFESSRINTMAFTDSYTVYGDVEKYMHLVIDAEDINNPKENDDEQHSPYAGGKKIEGSGRETKETIPRLSHGVHTLTRWLTAKVNGKDVDPKYQTFETIFFEEGQTAAVVSANTSDFEIDQYSTKRINFIVADPTDLTVDVRILIDGVEKVTFTGLDRTVHPWNYTPMESGHKLIRIEALRTVDGIVTVSAFKEFYATINPVQMNVEEVTDYIFKLKASELGSNNDLRTWHNSDNTVNLSFSDNFDWVNGGLQFETDDDGNIRQYICVKSGTRMTVNHKLFATAAQDTGLDFKIGFKVTNVQDYDSVWGSCFYNDRGIILKAHNAEMNAAQYVSTLYEEDSYIEYELEIYKRDTDTSHGTARHNYIMAWLDGVPANIKIYGNNDSFAHAQSSAPPITIGSDTCDVYVYLMKVYQHEIDYQVHVDNFIVDAPTGEEMVKRYNRNNILNSTTNDIDYEMLANNNRDLRIYLYDIPYLTMNKIKKDPVANCKFQQIWRNGGEEYQLQGTCTMGIQGTSSFNYRFGCANTDSRFSELTYTKGGQVVDLLEDGVYVNDGTYGDNWYVKDPLDPTVPRIYTKLEAYIEAKLRKTYSVKEAISLARLQEGEELDPTEWIVYEVDGEGNPVKYLRASEEDYTTKILGPEWVVRYRDEALNATHYVKALGFKVNDTSCPITYSNIKVNFASCEQVNNYCNAMWYQKYQPYPSRTARDCMEFSMGVQFIKDQGNIPDDGKHILLFTKQEVDSQGNPVMVDGKPKYVQDGKDRYHMYSIANMGTSKNNVHIFHDISNINEVCVEVRNNTNAQCAFKNYSDDPIRWDADGEDPFELRYPSTKKPETINAGIEPAWKRLWKWFSDNDPSAATNQPLSTAEEYSPYTFRGHHRSVPEIQNEELTNFAQVLRGTRVTQYAGRYTADTFNRRMAKMLSECEDYLVMDSVIYHYLFIERHTNVDNVAKNTFWSTDDLIHWDLSKAYDMDTSDGNNNEGIMSFDYGNEWDDYIGQKSVFNRNDSVWFVFAANLMEACKTMFLNREARGAWNYRTYHNFLKKEQEKVPERCWVQCYYYDYIRTYERQLEEVSNKHTYLDGGQKIHQREHFETFQEMYMSGKYNGQAVSSSAIILRGYHPDSYAPTVPPLPKVKLKMYNKMYAIVDVDGKPYIKKFEKGENDYIDFSQERLSDTVIKIYPANMIQEIDNLASIYGGDYSFGAAKRLKTLKLGSNAPGYTNSNFFDLRLENNPMLEVLEVQNLINGVIYKVGSLDLSHCPSLKTVDATGSDFTTVSFAKNGLIENVKLKAPTGLTMPNLRYLTDDNLTIADFSKVAKLVIENCDGIDALSMINTILNIQGNMLAEARLIGMVWHAGLTAETLAALYAMSGVDEGGYQTTHAVLAGEGSLLSLTRRLQNLYSISWPNFDLSVVNPTDEHVVTFVNEDGTPVLDKNGDEYFQYIEEGSSAYDPIEAGEINTPTIQETNEYTAVFSYFANLGGVVYADKVVTAMYVKTKKKYRVRWFTDLGGNELHNETVEYGSEAVYDYDANGYPTKGISSGVYSVFAGWDKSTGYITGPTDVYAVWDTYRGEVVKRNQNGPNPSDYVELKDMSVSQISAAIQQGGADEYWNIKDYIDINVGADYDFSNVTSQVIVGDNGIYNKDLVLNGNRVYTTNIKLFGANSPSFTLALDYEFTSETPSRTLVSCNDTSNGGGFQLVFQNATASPNITWGDQTSTVGNYGMKRGMLVLVHEKGSRTITIFSNNIGQRYNDLLFSNTITRSTTMTSEQATLVFGGLLGTNNSQGNMASGIIHWCKIWWDTLGSSVTRSLANWCHETWRMHYAGAAFYQKTKDQLWTNATFVSNAPLTEPHIMNSTSTNANGYSLTELRAFVDGGTINGVDRPARVFEALPLKWRALIQTVNLIEQQFYTDYVNRQTTFQARVHITAYRNYQSYDNYGYNDEDRQIPWYESSTGVEDLDGNTSSLTRSEYNRREQFPGIILTETTRKYRSKQDPSTSSALAVQLKDGDIWHNYNNSATYIYYSNSTLTQKGWVAGSNKNSTDQNYVFDAGNNIGKWFRAAARVWTRTHYPYTGYYFYTLDSGSLGASYSVSNAFYLIPMFSI